MILAWTSFFGIYLLIQGSYIFKTGVLAPFFVDVGQPTRSAWIKWMVGTVHVASGAGCLAVATVAMLHKRGGVHTSDVAPMLVFVLPGIWFLLRPETPIRWARTAYPNIPLGNPSYLVIGRIIGAWLILFGLLFFMLN